MTLLRLDHVGLVVKDMDRAVAFFGALGLEVEGRATIGGEWVDRLCALENTDCDIVLMRAPDGSGKIELAQYRSPMAEAHDTRTEITAPGLRSVMFEVDNIHAVLSRLKEFGGELVGDVAQYEDQYLLAYVTGPAGMVVALAEAIQ